MASKLACMNGNTCETLLRCAVLCLCHLLPCHAAAGTPTKSGSGSKPGTPTKSAHSASKMVANATAAAQTGAEAV